MTDVSLIDRLVDVLEHDIVPLTAKGVAMRKKRIGAASLNVSPMVLDAVSWSAAVMMWVSASRKSSPAALTARRLRG